MKRYATLITNDPDEWSITVLVLDTQEVKKVLDYKVAKSYKEKIKAEILNDFGQDVDFFVVDK